MLDFMRKKAKYFYIFFFLIIISFIFFYAQVPNSNNQDPVVAEVNDYKIRLSQYWRTYENLREYYRSIYQEKFNEKMEIELDLKRRAMDNLIEDRLLLSKAMELGLKVTDRELQEAIINNPLFQRNGVFNRQLYEYTLRANRLTPAEYEAAKMRELLLEKVRSMIMDAVNVRAEELKLPEGDPEMKKQILQAMIESIRQEFYRSYMEGLKREADIKIRWELIRG